MTVSTLSQQLEIKLMMTLNWRLFLKLKQHLLYCILFTRFVVQCIWSSLFSFRLSSFIFLGSYCATDRLADVTGNCSAGFYCNGSTILHQPRSEMTGDVCPQGYYCPEGSSAPIPCDEGHFNDLFGQSQVSNCQVCTAGKYCPGITDTLKLF